MGPAAAILAAASLAGAIFGGKRKQIDPVWLEQHFGAGAVTKEAMELFHNILNSSYGQEIMANAAEQGQQFGRDVNRRAAEAGLAGPGGSSGTGIFATSAAQGAGDALQRQASSQFYQLALPAAQQIVQSQLAAYMAGQQGGGFQQPNVWDKIGTAAGTIGPMITNKPKAATNTTEGTETISGPDTVPGQPGEDRTTINSSASAPQRVMSLPSLSTPLVPQFGKLRRFSPSTGSVQAMSGAYA
jgi:hypothetical protein